MADIEKVIKGLETCSHGEGRDCFISCPYFSHFGEHYEDRCFERLAKDALELLKEQEAMNVDAFVQWCNDSHIMGDATVIGIKYWVGKYKEIKGRSVKLE